MADGPRFDASAAWQELVSQWEKQINEFSAGISGSKDFAETMNQAANISFSARRAFDEAMEKLVQAFHVASQSQMKTLLDRLDVIEERLDRIALAVERNHQPASPRQAEPRRTRRPATKQ